MEKPPSQLRVELALTVTENDLSALRSSIQEPKPGCGKRTSLSASEDVTTSTPAAASAASSSRS